MRNDLIIDSNYSDGDQPVPAVHVQPRNTFVTLRVFKEHERTQGTIVVPANNDEYAEAEVIAVGRGIIAAGGGTSGTEDLRPGMRVLVKTRRRVPGGGPQGRLMDEGLPLARYDGSEIPGAEFTMFDETNILAILTRPGDDNA